MLSREAIEEQLTKIGCNFRFWGRSEIRELDKILMEDEIISQCVNGEYTNGFAMLIATNHRLLLVDKKPLLYLTVEDIRFDMITDFNFNHRLTTATICISTPNKALTFMSWNKKGLRKLLDKLQQQVLELRKQHHMSRYFDSYQSMPQMPLNQQMPDWQQAPMPMQQLPPRQVEPQSYYTPNLAPQPASENANPVVAQAMNHASFVASKLAAKRSALGTYTRSKMPTFRHHDNRQSDAQTGEVYPGAYRPTATPDYQMPYEY
jgi:hypothetical protein